MIFHGKKRTVKISPEFLTALATLLNSVSKNFLTVMIGLAIFITAIKGNADLAVIAQIITAIKLKF
ncbi:hypothetical protein LTX14_002915 [Clostridium perfringens]|uniref:hypothetical protein n=1 Tax=Clostridium perfringens TaxID=1502 RepID=UPI002857D9AB|nr:hypothetical protein [Clostridium perfringens]ELC8426433.1 hypothetical protein [Clostridium perfringens]